MTSFKQYRLALQVFQSARLRRDYADLALIPQYTPVGDFFFDEMYGPRDFSDRNSEARRIQHLLHVLPGVRIRDLEEVLELLDLTNQLDDQLARMLQLDAVGLDFDEPTYERYYRQADNYEARLLQLNLVRSCTYTVFRISRSQLLGMALHRSGLFARLVGIEAAHDFLVKGYDALCGVSDVTRFAETVHIREFDRLNRIFEVSSDES
ncbi:MAG: FFLEELY motif protein [Oscillochloridaceae bacterium umkhey_bin13]